MPRLRKHAFSLIELIVALALFSLVILGIVEFFPQVYRLGNESQQATRSVFLAEEMIALLKATAPQGVVATGPAWKNFSDDTLFFSLLSPSIHCIAYDINGQPRHLVTAKEYQQPLHEEGISSLACVIVTPKEDMPNLSEVHITISAPARVPEKERRHVEFSLLLSTLPLNENISE